MSRPAVFTGQLTEIAARDEGFLAALEAAGLPTSDLGQGAHQCFALVGARAERLGYGALQRYGTDALLRSVVIAGSARRRGIGGQLVELLSAKAREIGIERLYLLTLDAAPFFERHGFERIARGEVPEGVGRSAEFAELCPNSATAMAKHL